MIMITNIRKENYMKILSGEFKVEPQIKTIRFEAKPVWETKEHIKNYINKSSRDRERKENYDKVKTILNQYAKLVIDKATYELTTEGMTPTYVAIEDAYKNLLEDKNKDTTKKYEKITKEYKKHIVNVISTHAEEYQLIKKHAELFNIKKSKLINNTPEIALTEKDIEIITSYHGFTKMFDRYFMSLTSTILCGEGYGSIAQRIIENIEIWHNNKARINNIKEKYEELYENIREKFLNTDITSTMSQKNIDKYNAIIGNTNNDGINELISIYRDSNKVKVSYLKKLKKIPLMEENKQIEIKKLESDEQLNELIKESIETVKSLTDFALQCCRMIDTVNAEYVYIKEKTLPAISVEMYGNYNKINNILNTYYETYKIKTKNNEEKNEKLVSMEVLEKAIALAKEEQIMPIRTLRENIKTNISEIVQASALIKNLNSIIDTDNAINHKDIVKSFYEKAITIRRALNIFDLENDKTELIEEIALNKDKIEQLTMQYNKARNYCTRNQTKIVRYPIYFNRSAFLSSFDIDKFKEGTSMATILRNEGKFYLMILNPEYSNKPNKKLYSKDGKFEQLVYKQLTGLNKTFPKVFLSKIGEELYKPTDEIREIAKKKLYTKAANDKDSLEKWIRFCIDCFYKNPVWTNTFNPQFKEPHEYEAVNEFYESTEKYLIKIEFSEKINEDALKEMVKEGKIFLFQIYSRDFSPYHTEKDSIYTSILKEMFSDENLEKINNTCDTAIKLASGGSELVFQPACLPYHETHPANIPINNKNALNPKKSSIFPYAICKNKRLMFDRFKISIAVQLGFRNSSTTKFELNKKINKLVLEHKPNILTVRAAEGHLLYCMVHDYNGRVLEEKSLNVIKSEYTDIDNNVIEVLSDYKSILRQKEKEIEKAKEHWDYSKDIKNVKRGYLSHAIHQITLLQQKYSAIIFVEDYTCAMISERRKNIKTIYQQFQRALIQKYSCFTNKGGKYNEAVQLAYPINLMEDLKGQTGIIYFINPTYTAKTDYTTGFMEFFTPYFTYKNIKTATESISKIKEINYNTEQQEYEIILDEKDFNLNIDTTNCKTWTLHTRGKRTAYLKNKNVDYDCTERLKAIFAEFKITNLNELKTKKLSRKCYEDFFEVMQIILKMHYYDADTNDEYTLSPVQNNKDRLDTRTNKEILNTAAVKTHLLYLKGKKYLELIDKETMLINFANEKGMHKEKWIEYLRSGI